MMRPALFLMAGRIVGFVATFFVPLILVRVLDQSQFGTYKQLFLVFGTLYALAQVGMAESLYYFLPSTGDDSGEGTAEEAWDQAGGRRADLGGFIGNALAALALSGALSWALLTAFGGHVAGWLNNPALEPLLPLIGVYLILSLISAVFEITLISRERYGGAATVFALSDIARSTLIILPVLLVGGLRWLLYGALAFAVLRVLATLVYLVARLGIRPRLDAGLLRRQVSYSAPFQLSVVFDILEDRAPDYVVSWASGAATYAIFSVGCLQIPIIDLVDSSVGNVLMVKMRRSEAAGDREGVLRIWTDVTRKLALLFFPLAALLWLGAHDLIVLLFTADYVAAVPVFMVWIAFVALAVLQTEAALRVYAETRFLAGAKAASFAVTLGLLAVLLPGVGLPGAVLAAVGATLVFEAVGLRRFAAVLGVSWSRLLPWKELGQIAALSCAAALPAWLAHQSLALSPFFSLVLLSSTYGLAYLFGALALDVVDADERRLLNEPFRRSQLFPLRLQPVREE